MNRYEFIFSNTRLHRLARHISFWLCWIMFASAVQLTGPDLSTLNWDQKILYQIIRTITRLLPQILFCYATVYFLVPWFIPKKKYLQFFFLLLMLFMAMAFITFKLLNINGGLTNYIFGFPAFNPFISKFYGFYSNINFTGAIPACCLMLAIKYYKDWYKKQSESEMLIRENKQAELQLLKAQIHPHFLFNTLNNIYSFTLTGSPQAEGLVNKLSGMIDYITTEGAKSFVPVEKEIQLINDYIGLEKVRYGDRLDMQVEINGDYKNKMIAPLLLIPFVENCFKHGASVMRGQQWIRLSIQIKENQLDLHLSNSKPPQAIGTINKKGIGLANVRKRLQLLYPEKHFLQIESTSDSFIVHLQVSLEEFSTTGLNYIVKPTLQII